VNYFNYFTEIEDTFIRRRGKHLLVSNLDWCLMETWKERGIPLHIVLRAVEKSFDSYEAKPRKRSVKTLFYCQEEVEAQYAEWLESRLGAPKNETDPLVSEETPFSREAIAEHLERNRESLLQLAAARRPEDDLSEAMTRAAALLLEIEADLNPGAPLDTRKLEDSLSGLERLLNNSMFAVASAADLEAQKTAVKDQLKPYRNQMETSVYNQTFNNLLLKRLREQFAVPRLSLFYV
jgi:hypothetical protein